MEALDVQVERDVGGDAGDIANADAAKNDAGRLERRGREDELARKIVMTERANRGILSFGNEPNGLASYSYAACGLWVMGAGGRGFGCYCTSFQDLLPLGGRGRKMEDSFQ